MAVLFQTTDPLQRSIVCTDERWNEHVLSKRPWMDSEDWIELVKRAIEAPMYICNDVDEESREVYYYIPAPKSKYLKVIVRFQSNKGEVITAFPTDSGKQGEKIKWPTSSD